MEHITGCEGTKGSLPGTEIFMEQDIESSSLSLSLSLSRFLSLSQQMIHITGCEGTREVYPERRYLWNTT